MSEDIPFGLQQSLTQFCTSKGRQYIKKLFVCPRDVVMFPVGTQGTLQYE
jgi:hypothetical protein